MNTTTTPIIFNSRNDQEAFDKNKLTSFIRNIHQHFPSLHLDDYLNRIHSTILQRDSYTSEQLTNLLILEGLSNINEQEPEWTFFCAQIYLTKLYKESAVNRRYDKNLKYGSFYDLIETLVSKGLYHSKLLDLYSKEEIEQVGTFIQPENDKLFTYIGLRTLADRYLTRDFSKQTFELPQERFLIIAMTLMAEEKKDNRLELVKQAYWAMSNLYMTVATPTLSNAGKPIGQLSSCFIDTIDDSLQGIFDSNTDIANLSKSGGGIGAYLGKIRSRGSDIKGFKGVSSGVKCSPLVA
ncbi:MAG: ribonucleotide reductase N-terminal alpha domain-containing protein [Bacillota bacterium]